MSGLSFTRDAHLPYGCSPSRVNSSSTIGQAFPSVLGFPKIESGPNGIRGGMGGGVHGGVYKFTLPEVLLQVGLA